ncbi:hypothetical protein EBB07_24695 [Paenibacillaceae bacterium]|nr:hypothetical protein EBB07_24695 [Paenibacillaceae bacterium]
MSDATGQTAYTYKATTGELTQVTYPDLVKQISLKNGNTSYFNYEGMKLTHLSRKQSDGAPLHTFTYEYDPNGNITSRSGSQSERAFTDQFTYNWDGSR